MPSEFDVAYFVGSLAMIAVFAFAAYTAFAIRRTLSSRTYRSLAMGIGMVAVVFAVLLLNNFVYSYIPPNTPQDTVDTNLGWGVLISFALFFVLFYWIDESVLASRRADPLFRDTFHWSSARKVLRPWFAFSAIFLGVVFVVIATLLSSTNSASSGPPAFLLPFYISLIIGPPVLGIILLPVSAIRARDPLLRRQLYWFGAFAAAYLADAFLEGSIPNPSTAFFASIPIAMLSGFCLYMSVRSLVPVYRFSSETSATIDESTS